MRELLFYGCLDYEDVLRIKHYEEINNMYDFLRHAYVFKYLEILKPKLGKP